jgi:hypothetical protein
MRNHSKDKKGKGKHAKNSTLENPLLEEKELAPVEFPASTEVRNYYPLQQNTHNPLFIEDPHESKAPESVEHQQPPSPAITGLPPIPDKVSISTPDLPLNRKHSTQTNQSSDGSGGYQTATSGDQSKNHSITTDSQFVDALSRRQTFTGITSDENYWHEGKGPRSYSNPPLFRNPSSLTMSTAGNACNLINERINSSSLRSADSSENFGLIDFTKYQKKEDQLPSPASSNSDGKMKYSRSITFGEEDQVVNNNNFNDPNNGNNNNNEQVFSEDPSTHPVKLPSTSLSARNESAANNTVGSGSSSQELLVNNNNNNNNNNNYSASISRPSTTRVTASQFCCVADYCLPCIENGSPPYSKLSSESSSQSTLWNCFNCCYFLTSFPWCFSNSFSSSYLSKKNPEKNTIEVGDLYEFHPRKEIPYFLLYESPNINHRYYTIIRKPSSMIFILGINGNYKLIQSNGYEGWIYLPNNVIYPAAPGLSRNQSEENPSITNSARKSAEKDPEKSSQKTLIPKASNCLQLVDHYPLYKEWNGENYFFLGGKVMLGNDKTFFLLTLLAYLGCSATFFFLVLDDLTEALVWKVSDDFSFDVISNFL